MRILSLDLARLMGWSVGSPDGVEGFGTHELPKTDSWELGEYGLAARLLFRRMLKDTEAEHVVYESPILRSGKIKTRQNGKQFVGTIDTPAKLRKMYGLPFELEIECRVAGVPVREANIGSVRKSFLMGKVPQSSEACKTAVKVMARRRGWDVHDDNEADSLAVLDFELIMKCPRQMAALKINAGRSVGLSSSGPGVFVGSRQFFPPATRTASPEQNQKPGAGPSDASSTATGSQSGTMAIIPPSPALRRTSSTSSGRQPTPQFQR